MSEGNVKPEDLEALKNLVAEYPENWDIRRTCNCNRCTWWRKLDRLIQEGGPVRSEPPPFLSELDRNSR